MQLTLEQVKDITHGTTRLTQESDGFHFYRFTKEQEYVYEVINPNSHMKTFATAGVKMEFKTNTKSLYLRATVSEGSSRKFFSFDIFVNGKPLDYLDNFGDMTFEPDYTKTELPYGTYDKTFDLGAGEKKVTIYFPWSVKAVVEEISIDEGAYVEGIKTDKVMVAFGDSITHGYDAVRPSNRYASLLAEALGAEEINKAIGGEMFYGPLAEPKEPNEPDYILVAYGTNDWNCCPREEFYERCSSFYTALCKNYPNSKIIGLTPIWRADCEETKAFGKFEDAVALIHEITAKFPNVSIFDCFDCIPHDRKYYSDLYLHPTDEGFRLYAQNLIKKMNL